jgi:hypothetical protein
MWDPASSPLRAILAVVAAAGGTTLFWTLVTGDLNEAAGYGVVVLIIMGGWAAIELRKRR